MAIVEKLREQVEQALLLVFQKNNFSLHAFSGEQISSFVRVEACKRPQYGDFYCSVAMQLAQGSDLSAISLAHEISSSINMHGLDLCTANVRAPGFINFNVNSNGLSAVLLEIHSSFTEADYLCPEVFICKDSEHCYALCCSILRGATESAFDLINEVEMAPILAVEQWQECKMQYKRSKQSFKAAFATESHLFKQQKGLVLMLDRALELFIAPPQAQIRTKIVDCAPAIAESFAKFYQGTRIFTDQLESTKARLGLVLAVKLILEQMFVWQSEKASELS